MRNGISSVVQLSSAASARAELATAVREGKALGQRETFRVPRIPDAVGSSSSVFKSGAENIVFADGPFVYDVGNAWTGSTRNPSHLTLIDAAIELYERVHGHPAR